MSDRRQIIYIEDNVANLDLVKRVLRSTGLYDVVGATDGETGLELIRRGPPSLVLVDLDIPGLNGFEVIRQIKASDDPAVSETPVAVVTANVITRERDQAMQAGCVAFIEKPFDIRAFRDTIARLIEASQRP